MSIIQRYVGWLNREANNMPHTKAEVMRCIAKRIESMEKENKLLRCDEARIDWLADPENKIGNVQLPSQCVIAHPYSMRDAIDDAMNLEAA